MIRIDEGLHVDRPLVPPGFPRKTSKKTFILSIGIAFTVDAIRDVHRVGPHACCVKGTIQIPDSINPHPVYKPISRVNGIHPIVARKPAGVQVDARAKVAAQAMFLITAPE